jgi:hypothetical protein
MNFKPSGTAKSRCLLACMVLLALTTSAISQTGQFVGELKYKPIGGGNHEVLEYFEFVSPDGLKWGVPKGTITDGASIPRVLWTIVGSPYGGHYVRAAVVHDYYCEIKTRDWKDVHRVFYEVMLADKESAARAKWMYLAVYYAGPRWSKSVMMQNRSVCKTIERDSGPAQVVCSTVPETVSRIDLTPPVRPRSAAELAKAPTAARIEQLLSSTDGADQLENVSLQEIETLSEAARNELLAAKN